MKLSISTFALALFMTGASSMLVTQSAYAEDEPVETTDDSDVGAGDDDSGTPKEASGDDLDGFFGENSVDVDGVFSCLECEPDVSLSDVDPQILQTSGGPEVQRDDVAAGKAKSRPAVIMNSDEDVPYHEIMRKKRRAAKVN